MGMSPDFDHCELHVTIKNYFTAKPYVDTNSAIASMNMPIESCDITDQMYEPGRGAFSTCSVVFPSLIENPKLRPLLQLIQEGDRIEIFHLQGDVGDPVFAGWIPPGGITVENGHVRLDCGDAMSRGKWDRLRQYETFNTNASGYFTRAMSRWTDIVNEDFSAPNNDPSIYTVTTHNGTPTAPTWLNGSVILPSGASGQQISLKANAISAAPPLTLAVGSVVLLEATATVVTAATQFAVEWILGLFDGNNHALDVSEVSGLDPTNNQYGVAHALERNNATGVIGVQEQVGSRVPIGNLGTSVPLITNNYAALMTVNADLTVSIVSFVNYIPVQSGTMTFKIAPNSQWWPWIMGGFTLGNSSLTISKWRVRTLVPWISRAARFNPQTQDASFSSATGAANAAFAAGADDNLAFLDTFVELDYAEYRPIYHQYPQLDELELDRYYTLGQNASQALGQDTPVNAVPVSPTPTGTQPPVFTVSGQPFRIEEGYNLSGYPKIQKKQTPHANGIVRMGAGTLDAQNFAERWSVAETGNPILNAAGLGGAPQFPYFETVINDDRTTLPAAIQNLAANDLAVRLDNVPSMQVDIAENVQHAFKYRAGDFVRVKTQSLLTNLDQDMRIMSIAHRHGEPTRAIVVGHLPFDPNNSSLLAQDMVEAWLYNQAGSSPLTYVYPFAGVQAGSGTASGFLADFTFPLDALTSGSAIIYAALHWFASVGLASDWNISIGAAALSGANLGSQFTTTAAGTDSGLVNVTGVFANSGVYHMAAQNNNVASRTLSGLFLVLKVKS